MNILTILAFMRTFCSDSFSGTIRNPIQAEEKDVPPGIRSRCRRPWSAQEQYCSVISLSS